MRLKRLAALAASSLVLFLAACGSNDDGTSAAVPTPLPAATIAPPIASSGTRSPHQARLARPRMSATGSLRTWLTGAPGPATQPKRALVPPMSATSRG